jgi:MFS family permease
LRDVLFRNALLYAVPELFWGYAHALTLESAMPGAFAEGFGGTEAFVGAVALAIALGSALPMPLTGWVVDPLPRKAGFVFWGHLATGALYGLVALFLHFADPIGLSAVRAAYLASIFTFFLALGFLMPAWLALLGDLVPEGSRGRVLGFTFVLNRVGAWAGGETAHAVLSSGSAPRDAWSLLFLLAMAAAMLGSFPFAWLVEEARERRPRPPLVPYLKGFFGSFHASPGLRRFIVADVLGVTGLVVAFHFSDTAIRRHGIDPAWAGRWTSATSLAQLGAALLVTWLGRRLRPRLGLAAGVLCVAGAAALAAFAVSPVAFAVVAALAGCHRTLRMTCHSPQVMRLAPGRERTGAIGLAMVVAAPVAGLGPLAAGAMIPLLGYRPVFLAVGAVCLLSFGLLGRWVPDTEEPPVTSG